MRNDCFGQWVLRLGLSSDEQVDVSVVGRFQPYDVDDFGTALCERAGLIEDDAVL